MRKYTHDTKRLIRLSLDSLSLFSSRSKEFPILNCKNDDMNLRESETLKSIIEHAKYAVDDYLQEYFDCFPASRSFRANENFAQNKNHVGNNLFFFKLI